MTRTVLAASLTCPCCGAFNRVTDGRWRLRDGTGKRVDDGVSLVTIRVRCHVCGFMFGAGQVLYGS